MASVGGLSQALNGLLTNLATLAVLAAGILLVDAGQLDGVYLAMLAMAVISTFEVVLPLAPALQSLENSREAGRRLFEIVDSPPKSRTRSAPPPTGRGSRSLSARGLSFTYGPGLPPVLDGIDFDLPRALAWPSSDPAAQASRPWPSCCCASGTTRGASARRRKLREYAQESGAAWWPSSHNIPPLQRFYPRQPTPGKSGGRRGQDGGGGVPCADRRARPVPARRLRHFRGELGQSLSAARGRGLP